MAEETNAPAPSSGDNHMLYIRQNAIYGATELAKLRGVTTISSADILKDAAELLAFVVGETAAAPKAPRRTKLSTTSSDSASTKDATTAETAASSTQQKTSDPVVVSATTTETIAPTIEDDFLSETPKEEAKVEEPKYELKDVRAVLVDLQTKVSKDTAMKVLEEHGKVTVLGNLKPEHFAAVVKAAKAKLPK